ncbi:uncharacterized protein L203_101852 [Cryptococcus depauperatus CBS 7841]|uniref:THO complex subunit 2 n=1 Tax=Cryptococcus depauperatus CBS 7841 TaxID=1295531 RepID=A0A1E3IJK8_9TREE|nr:THO complex subunit 2 [Cryptococcus depauperatus CBS 7841]
MPPRRGRKSQPEEKAGTVAETAKPLQIPPELSSAIVKHLEEWDSHGTEALHALIISLLSVPPSVLSTVPLLHTLVTLIKADVDERELTGLFEGLLDELEDERKDILGEALVDAIEMLEEDDTRNDTLQMEEGKEPNSRGTSVIKLLLESHTLPAHIPNLLLNPDRLLSLSLHPIPRNPKSLQNALVKKNTSLFFKQRKFNLLRECSEGFSGLIVLLTSEDALSPRVAEEDQNERRERASSVWSKIMRLIGYFNLSPPRVLDVLLEVAACHVTQHWQFFLELLRCSPWGATSSSAKGKEKEELSWKEEEIRDIGEALVRDGDRVLSQVLGFKFGWYRKLEAGDTPRGLIYIAALLIKHGLMNLSDIVPFLSPDDAEMEVVRKQWASSLSSRSGPSNALTDSVLDDDDPVSTSTSAAQNEEILSKPPPEQRIQLTEALFALSDKGAVKYMLGRWPWIAQKSTIVADLILDLVDHAVDSVYQDMNGAEDEFDLGAMAPFVDPLQEKDEVLTLEVPTPPETITKRFKFFYPGHHDVYETWKTNEEIHEKGLRWLGLIRGMGGRRSSLMIKLCRIAARHFEQTRKEKVLQFGIEDEMSKKQLHLLQPTSDELKPWLDILRISILPSLSCSSASAAFDVELWNVLKLFPYTVRYSLYGEWRDSTCNADGRNPCLVATHSAAITTKEVQKALRRVTSTNSATTSGVTQSERHSARALAKQSHGNPMFVWTTAVTQVKAYPNIGEAIVDAGRYMTQLSYDVATFVMLDTLADDRAQRLNEMGTGVALWLERLSKFVGDFNRRYINMDLNPVLQYIINRLMRGHSGDIIILEKLMSSMSGIEPIPNDGVSEAQLQAYAGGREIIREAFSATRIQIQAPPEPGLTEQPVRAPIEKVKNLKKSLPRLVNALREQGLAMPIWIALGQTRQAVIDKLVNTPIKAMNLVQDTCHNAFIQFGDFLVDHLTSDEHITLTPNLQQLIVSYGLEYGTAFQILRPRLNVEIGRVKMEEKAAVQARLTAAKKAISEKDKSTPASPQKEGSPALPVETSTPSTPTVKLTLTPVVTEGEDVIMEETDKNGLNVPPPKNQSGKGKMWWPSALTPTMQQTRKLLPREANEIMSAPFFVIFWHLTTSDIAFSPESYDNAIKSINRHISTVSSWRINPREKNKVVEQQDELARLRARAENLTKEKELHGNAVNGPMRRRMRMESSKWFGKTIIDKNLQRPLAIQLHQYCFYPRAILSPCDAVFVAKFIRMAHDLGTPGFSTVFAYNNFFNDNLTACIFSCTDSEARNLGRCLALILGDLDKWHQNEKVYLQEALGITSAIKEGEERKRLPGMLFKAKAGDDMREMSWQEFRNFYAKCHNVLSRALISCWSEAEFMHNKNAIIVALQVIKFFPIMETNGTAVENAIKSLQAGEVGEIPSDLKMMCTSFLSSLKKRQESRPFVHPTAFHGAAARNLATRFTPQKDTNDATAPTPAQDIIMKSTPSKEAIAAIVATDHQPSNGTTAIPAALAPDTPTPDPDTLRKRVEESRARAAASVAAAREVQEALQSTDNEKFREPKMLHREEELEAVFAVKEDQEAHIATGNHGSRESRRSQRYSERESTTIAKEGREDHYTADGEGRESKQYQRDSERERDREDRKEREKEREKDKESDKSKSHRGDESSTKHRREDDYSRKYESEPSGRRRDDSRRDRDRRKHDERDRERGERNKDREKDRDSGHRDRKERDRSDRVDDRSRDRDRRRRERDSRETRDSRDKRHPSPLSSAHDDREQRESTTREREFTAASPTPTPIRTPHALPARPEPERNVTERPPDDNVSFERKPSDGGPRIHPDRMQWQATNNSPMPGVPPATQAKDSNDLVARTGIARPPSPLMRTSDTAPRSVREETGKNEDLVKEEPRREIDRKRALEAETGQESREESPGASKRVKIDRNKARGRKQEGGGAGRMFQQAMGNTKDK